ncbi:MAG: hypothetical protein IT208_18810 [Chthonomonadales bacterium]|nr:hypothetical protein [Chthonomonadales bacterium]
MGWALCLCAVTAAGCRPPAGRAPASGTIALPPDGQVRLLARKVEGTGEAVHWVWAVVGERNWGAASWDGRTLRLSRATPLSSPGGPRGTHIWEIDYSARRRAGPGGGVATEEDASVRGTNAVTASVSFAGPDRTGRMSARFEAAVTGDTLLRLPARTDLARLDGKAIAIDIER